MNDAIVVRFARDGARAGVELSKDLEYQVTVDDGPWETFRSPWDKGELDEIIGILRNTDPEQQTETETLAAMGRQLGEALVEPAALLARLRSDTGGRRVVFWQLDYPELARIPWELASWQAPPHHHMLLDPDVTFVRTIPLYHSRLPNIWPTGLRRRLRLLFVWAETPGASVPHRDHLDSLEETCSQLDVDLVACEIRTVTELTALTAEQSFDFVHILAHGCRTGTGEWGLRMAEQDANGELIARAVNAGATTPALVTLAACDSANEPDDSFGSVAYQLHAHGIPMVVGSQFRLRKSVSTTSSAQIYGSVLAGIHPFEVMSTLRRQLSPNNDEAWSNEVLYMNYPLPTLDTGAAVGRQRAALRHARVIARRHSTDSYSDSVQTAIDELELQIASLHELTVAGFDLPGTYGLIGSITRRIAYLRSDPPDNEELRDARDLYLSGLRADANSFYCGINAVHLSLMIGDQRTADELLPVVAFVSDSLVRDEHSDHWAWASAGEVAVYRGDAERAMSHYREFIRRARQVLDDRNEFIENLETAARQLRQFLAGVASPDSAEMRSEGDVRHAAEKTLELLDNAKSKAGTGP